MRGIREQMEEKNKIAFSGVPLESYRIVILNFAVYGLVNSIAPAFGKAAENLAGYLASSQEEEDFQDILEEVERYLKKYESSECKHNSPQVFPPLDHSYLSSPQSWKNRTSGVSGTSLL